jgi:hypothetical protein
MFVDAIGPWISIVEPVHSAYANRQFRESEDKPKRKVKKEEPTSEQEPKCNVIVARPSLISLSPLYGAHSDYRITGEHFDSKNLSDEEVAAMNKMPAQEEMVGKGLDVAV